jgi:hypothetical protein
MPGLCQAFFIGEPGRRVRRIIPYIPLSIASATPYLCMAAGLPSSTKVNHPIWLVILAFLLKILLTAIPIRVSWLMEKARPEHHRQLIVTATGAFLLLVLAIALIPNG